jgi:arylamine N-acetyltransferase
MSGFGDNFLEPLRLTTDIEQQDPVGTFRFVQTGERWSLEVRQPDGPGDCSMISPCCSIATPNGGVTVSGIRLITTSNDRKEETLPSTEAEWHSALRDHFGIALGQGGQSRPQRQPN